jgi:prophage regulatory protein
MAISNQSPETKLNSVQINQLPSGFLRIWQIVGDKKRNIPPLIPIGRTTFLNKVKEGKYPKPVKLGERITAWRVEDIKALIAEMGGAV